MVCFLHQNVSPMKARALSTPFSANPYTSRTVPGIEKVFHKYLLNELCPTGQCFRGSTEARQSVVA